MSRIDRDPDEQIGEHLSELRATLDEMKRPQFFGAANVRVYRLFKTGSSPDLTLFGLGTTPRAVEVTLTPTSAVSNPAIAYDFAFTVAYPGTYGLYYNTVSMPPVGGVQKFRVYLRMVDSGVTVDAALRFTFWTISPGQYSAVEIPV